MYHRVLPSADFAAPNAYHDVGTLISTDEFELALDRLLALGKKFVTVSQLLRLEVSADHVALTFDDGYSDNFKHVLPLLERRRVKATFFPVVVPCRDRSVLPLDDYYQRIDESELSQEVRTDLLVGEAKKSFYWKEPHDQRRHIDTCLGGPPERSRVSYLDQAELKELTDLGHEVGSHGMTHSLLTAEYMSEDMSRIELQESKAWLEHATGKPVQAYCFPAGRHNKRLIELAAEVGYTSTCIVRRQEGIAPALPSFERIFMRPGIGLDLE